MSKYLHVRTQVKGSTGSSSFAKTQKVNITTHRIRIVMSNIHLVFLLVLSIGVCAHAFPGLSHSRLLRINSNPQRLIGVTRGIPRDDLFTAIFSVDPNGDSIFNNFVIPGTLIALPSLAFIFFLVAEKRFATSNSQQ